MSRSARSALYEQFTQAATRVGAHVVRCLSAADASVYIKRHAGGAILLLNNLSDDFLEG